MNVTTEDFPVVGTLIMIAVFIYAWIADTSERKEAFTVKLGPPSRIETFYGGPPAVLPKYQAFAEQSMGIQICRELETLSRFLIFPHYDRI